MKNNIYFGRKLFGLLLNIGCFISIIIASFTSDAQTYYFRSKQSGNWNSTSSWEMSSDSSSWVNATFIPDFNCKNITILTNHQITFTASDTVDQLVVNGTLTYGDYSGSVLTINNGTGVDLTINGTFEDIGPSSIVWLSGSRWEMGSSGTLLRTRQTSMNYWRDNYNNGMSNIPSSANWILRKTGTASPVLTAIGGVYFPNLFIENYTGTLWETNTMSSFTGSSDYPQIKGSLYIGGNGTGDVSFLNSNSNATPIPVSDDINIKSGSTLRNQGTGFDIKGNFFVNGTLNYSSGYGALIQFSGTTAQQLSGAGTANVYNLTINKSSNDLTLGKSIIVDHLLTLSNGDIILDTNNLSIASSCSISGQSDSSYIQTNSTGKIIKKYSATGSTFIFPTGDSAYYTPFTLTLDSATFGTVPYIAVRVIDSMEPHVLAYDDYAERYWQVSANDISNITADIAYVYVDSDITGDESNFVATRWNATSSLKKTGIVIDSANTVSISGDHETGNFSAAGICNITANAGKDTSVILGDTIQIGNDGSRLYTYSWSPTSGLSNPTEANPYAFPDTTTTYTLTFTTNEGCISSDDITITCLNISGDTLEINLSVGVVADTNVHIIWDSTDINYDIMYVEKSSDSISFSVISSKTYNSVEFFDIHLCNYPDSINYWNNILMSTESGNKRYIFNEVQDSALLKKYWYRIKLLSGNILHFSEAISTFSNKHNMVDTISIPDTIKVVVSGINCPSVDTPPPGAIYVGNDHTHYGECCFWIETQYYVPPIQVDNWCEMALSPVPCCPIINFRNSAFLPLDYCSSGLFSDPCCVHLCSEYVGCSCHPWNCCIYSPAYYIWVVTSTGDYPALTITENVTNGCNNQGGSITINPTNGTAPYSYIWNTNPTQTTQTISNLPGGSYSVTVTDAHGCSATTTVAVTVYQPLAEAGSDQSMCASDSQTIGNPPPNYPLGNFSWSPSTGLSTPNLPYTNASPTTTTTYTVTCNLNGCTATDDVTVTVYPIPTVTISASETTICNGQHTDLIASGASTYSWMPGNLSGVSVNVSPSTSTTYTVTGTDANQCSASNYITITVGAECPCQGDQNAMPYTWNSGTPPLITGQAYWMNNDVLVNGPYTISDNIFSIDPNLKIVVDNGGILTINHCHLYACSDMWQGIVVKTGGILIINDQYSTGSTLIEDAIVAVDMHSPNQTNQLLIDSTIFNRNLDGISLTDYLFATTLPYSNIRITNSVFTSRDIYYCPPLYNGCGAWPTVSSLQTLVDQGTLSEHYSVANYSPANLKPPNDNISASSGIILEDMGALSGSYFEILLNGDNGNSTINLFDDLLYGIKATNSNFTCQNSAFQFIVGTTESWDDGIAVFAGNTSTQLPLSPQNKVYINGGNNYFYDCKTAVNVMNYDDINIRNVDIRSDQSSGTLEGAIGIFVLTPQCSEMIIDTNTLSDIGFGISFYNYSQTDQNITGVFEINGNTIQANLNGINGTVTNEIVGLGIVASTLFNGIPEMGTNCTPLYVDNNHLYNVRNGILMENWQFYENSTIHPHPCYGNRPHMRGNYISLVDPDASSQFGINTSYDENCLIYENTIHGFSNQYLGYFGIRCDGNIISGQLDYTQNVVCNDVDSTGTGIEFDENQAITMFYNNTMSGCQQGLVLMNDGRIGKQGNENTNYACNNSWPANTYTLGQQYKTYVVNSYAPLSPLVIDITSPNGDENPETGGIGFNGTNQSGNNWEYSISLNNSLLPINGDISTIACNPPNSKILDPGNGQADVNNVSQVDRLERMVVDSMHHTIFAEQQHINDLFMVYRRLEFQPGLKDSSSVLNSFYSAAHNGNIGILANIENAIADGNLSQAISYLNSITPQNNIESNYIDLYRIFIHYKDSTYTSTDSIILRSLAEGCPVRDGMAVRKARTLYSMLYKDYTLLTDLCIDPNVHKKHTDVAKENYKPDELNMEVYPNPNNGTFTISLYGNKSAGGSAEIKINDMLGNQIGKVLLEFRNNIATFDTKLTNGIYFISVIDAEGNVYDPKKIVVIK